MAKFDKSARLVHLKADHGIPMMLKPSLDEMRIEHTAGNWAISCFGMAVEAALCKLDREAALLLSRASEWLPVAISDSGTPPNYFPNYSEAETRRVLAITNWLQTATLYFTQVRYSTEVAHCLPTFVLAERWDELLSHFEKCRRLEPPNIGRQIKCPGKMSYLFARHKTVGDPDFRVLRKCFEGFMSYQMPVCLNIRRNGLGVWQDVPTWTLIVEIHFGGKSESGPANIRRALRYI